mmetsp:Transcript_27624/g.95061  ORF Transcript_27624/g.95061 Transcript_27624/m.95061 type:complete len:224 (+) Transcript_27624:61-732(+)
MLSRACFVALLLSVASGATDCADLAATLRCDACNIFVDSYYAEAQRTVFKKRAGALAAVYSKRLEALYSIHSPDKVSTVSALLAKAKGREHDLYSRVCAKYGAAEEPRHDDSAAKAVLARAALKATVPALDRTQWATIDEGGASHFVDFNKAMSAGSITGSLSMGGDVTDNLKNCFKLFVADHEDQLVARIAGVSRIADSKLHKDFCDDQNYCPTDPADFSEL